MAHSLPDSLAKAIPTHETVSSLKKKRVLSNTERLLKLIKI